VAGAPGAASAKLQEVYPVSLCDPCVEGFPNPHETQALAALTLEFRQTTNAVTN
jgi:hypothetical protein